MGSKKKYDMQDAINAFFLDCREMLDEMESSLLQLEKDISDEESINSLFRAIHTIKGASGMFGFVEIEKFTHIVENMLDDVRKGLIQVDSDLIALLLKCHDYVDKLVVLFEDSKDNVLDKEMTETGESLYQKLNTYLSTSSKLSDSNTSKRPELSTDTLQSDGKQVLNECWHISIRFGEDVFRNRLDPMPFIKYLGEIGEIVNIITVCDRIPTLEEIDPESCYLGFEIDFKGNVDKEILEDAFEFLIDDCTLRILSPKSSISEYVELIQNLPETPQRIGEILTKIGTLTELELEEAIRLQEALNKVSDEDQKKPLGEIVVEEKMVQESVVNAALEKQTQVKKNIRSIRVDPEKLDHLINYVGELVITGASVKQLSEKLGDTELLESVLQMSKLIEDIRDSTMNVRMVQIGDTFRKFERVVRDLSHERGKEIKLIINGGETELDKTLIEKINDPLMHLVRNAVDHGIGTPEDRVKKGKQPQGTILLNAYHGTGSIIIEVSDDGGGLNREKILNKSIEKGLIQPGQDISDNELYQLIFEPGFSTAEKVTNISGRGVGMDVVKKNIQSLRGNITIDSKEGIGTTMRIHLPLTLAIIDGFMVKVGSVFYVLPLDMVIECSEITAEDISGSDAYNFLNLRGEILPFLRLRDFFNVTEGKKERENIVVVEYNQRRIGLVVDKLIGEFQTVIKPLGKIFRKLQWAIGATILGTGEVALILDVPILIQHLQSIESKGEISKEVMREVAGATF
ncbi:MAG: chemotaxis protein CheA [Spirochaetota bacterium]|nr:chemotaxis protein CheA [Spirochaetota bacterium]